VEPAQQLESRMAKRTAADKKGPIDWRAVLLDPLVRQILALIMTAVAVITLLTLFGVTSGRWVDAWVGWLQRWIGWGAYPAAAGLLLAGLIWLRHQLDEPVVWRWSPIVGLELVLLSLLGLTHAIIGRGDPMALLDEVWGAGLVGWAISVALSQYVGVFLTAVLLSLLLAVGMALAFDVRLSQVRTVLARVWGFVGSRLATAGSGRRARRRAASGSEARARAVRPRSGRGSAPTDWQAVPRAPSMTAERAGEAGVPGVVAEPLGALASFPAAGPEFALPPLSLLDEGDGPAVSDSEVAEKSRLIEETLAQFGLPVEVAEVHVGPSVTQFGVKPGYVERGGSRGGRQKVRVSQINTLADDIALALAAPSLRVEAPVPGRSLVGIEVPNRRVQLVRIREILESQQFRELDSPLTLALGRDVSGDPVVADLGAMPHLLIAGTTGSGKSVCIKSIATCLVCSNSPEELRLVLIDPKMVELTRFNGLPHLYGRVEVELERIVKVLRWVAWEMDERFKVFSTAGARSIDYYNETMKREGRPALPRIVVLIDELADLMMMAPEEVEGTICRVAQMARATGIHLVVATQRPSVDVVTGLIKSNFPARISFATASQVDSRVILDTPGSETLLGKGDMLYLAADAGYPVRLQGCFVSDVEAERVVGFWQDQPGAAPEEGPWEGMSLPPLPGRKPGRTKMEEAEDDLLEDAIKLVQSTGSASASLLQRRLRIGHPRAARLMEIMEEMGVIGPPEPAGRKRRVLGQDED
jgi:S-DNA-T family DNA segregation ATPase FtsK/SpoIIIE